MNSLRQKVDERFYPVVLILFDRLGEVDQELTKDWTKQQRETRQFITYQSLLKNMHHVFGIQNQFFAKMLFIYLAERGPMNTKVNYLMFLERLMPFWLQSIDPMLRLAGKCFDDDIQAKKQKQQDMNGAVYDLMNISGEKSISIIDLVEMCANFQQSTPLGQECHQMLQSYTERNLRASFTLNKLYYDKETFMVQFNKPCLVRDLDFALCKQF